MPKLVDHEAWLGSMDTVSAEADAIRVSYRYNALDREETLGLAYRKGDIVHDRITDRRVTVLAGTRKRVTAVSGA